MLDEIGELVDKWGVNEIQFEDDNTTADKTRAKQIFQGVIDRGYKVRFSFPNGVALWSLDEALIDLIVEAGGLEITLAFESGCQEVLSRIIRKPLDLEKARKMTRYIKQKKIRTNAFYMIGFPGETKEQMKQTFRFAHEVKTDMAFFSIANPLPGTRMYEIARKDGLLRKDFHFEDLAYSRSPYNEDVFPEGELEKMAGRALLKYTISVFFRTPRTFLKRTFVDLFFKRPRYTVDLAFKFMRRVMGKGAAGRKHFTWKQ